MSWFGMGIVFMVLLLAVPSVSLGHNQDWCGNTNLTKYYRSFENITWSNTWSSSWQTAFENARVEFNASQFTWFRGGPPIGWQNLNSSDTTIAGGTIYRRVTCGAPNLIQEADLYVNVPHFQASPHTTGQRHCVAIHEMGHVVGLGHNTITSIMNEPHSHRCHYWEIKKLQPHDISDIDFRY